VPNPPGVDWVGPVPQQQQRQQPGQQQRAIVVQDPKAGVIAAICYDQDRKQVGILTVRVP
jgi:hypothetical protein